MQMTIEEARSIWADADYALQLACGTMAREQLARFSSREEMPSEEECRQARATLREMREAKKINYGGIDKVRSAAMLVIDPTSCGVCSRKNCRHRDCMRRLPRKAGGTGACLNLEE